MTGENKGYSRDYEAQWPPMRGRIRVKLFDSEGKPTNPEITTRKELFIKVAELIPKMQSRQPGYVDPQQVRFHQRPAVALSVLLCFSPHGTQTEIIIVLMCGTAPGIRAVSP